VGSSSSRLLRWNHSKRSPFSRGMISSDQSAVCVCPTQTAKAKKKQATILQSVAACRYGSKCLRYPPPPPLPPLYFRLELAVGSVLCWLVFVCSHVFVYTSHVFTSPVTHALVVELETGGAVRMFIVATYNNNIRQQHTTTTYKNRC